MKLQSLDQLLLDELRDLYSAENQLTKALPKMARAASSPDLKAAFEDHLEVTRDQIERLDKVFKQLDANPRGKKCKAMEGLVEEGSEVISEGGEPAVVDAALIAAAQRVEHYEMAGYGCVRTFARQLGYNQVANLLQKTLDEEAKADQLLSKLAESVINIEAEEAEGPDVEENGDEEGLAGKVMEAASTATTKVKELVTSATQNLKKAVTGKRGRR